MSDPTSGTALVDLKVSVEATDVSRASESGRPSASSIADDATPMSSLRDSHTSRMSGSSIVDVGMALAHRAHQAHTNRVNRRSHTEDANAPIGLSAVKKAGKMESTMESIPSEKESSTRSAPPRLSRTLSQLRPNKFVPVHVRDTGVPVIADTSGLTKEWLTLAFRFRGLLSEEGTIDEVACKTIGEGQGEYGDLSLLTIVKATGGAPNLPTNMIAKMCPQSANLSSFMLKNIYLNEAHFYNDFSVEGGGLTRPECYHVAADTRSKRPKFCFLIENAVIGAAGGDGAALQYQRVEGIRDTTHMGMVLDELATFHARWWGCSGSKPPLQWAFHPLTSLGGLGRNAVPLLTKQALSLLPKLASDETYPDGTPVPKLGAEYSFLLGWKKQLKGRLRYLTKQLLRPPLTLCHCDAHLENIFFHERYEGGAAFIDFGNMMFKHALSDIAFFLGTCVDPEVRQQHEKDLVRRYWQKLVESGVEEYSFDLCWHDYRMQMWLAFLQAMAAAPAYLKQRRTRTGMFAHPSERKKSDQMQLDMYSAYNRRCAAALKELDWVALVADTGKACCSYFCCC
jgi:hypothetical protein